MCMVLVLLGDEDALSYPDDVASLMLNDDWVIWHSLNKDASLVLE